MTRSSLFTLAPLALLCVLSSSAEPPALQTPPPPAPAPSPAPPSAVTIKGPRRTQNIQYRAIDRGPGMGMHIGLPGMWWKNAEIAQKISLTTDQQKRMDDIFQQSRLQLIDLKANVEKQEVMLEPMLSANPPDTNKVLAQIDRVAGARAELEKANARMLLGIRGVLSADQWTKLQAEERENRRYMFHFKGGPDGPGDPGPRTHGHGPESLMIEPGIGETLQVAPGGPLSMLAPPALPDLGPAAVSIRSALAPATGADLDMELPPPPPLDLDQ
ncbi:MAG TPA: Spy/CpxP family protein refolding chaperone [Edaphobacter sp.]|nr:Spy/CpxP family protein refolding chaperone [Edaphobacter sp.]